MGHRERKVRLSHGALADDPGATRSGAIGRDGAGGPRQAARRATPGIAEFAGYCGLRLRRAMPPGYAYAEPPSPAAV